MGALRPYLARFPAAASAHHVRRTPDGTFDVDDLQAAAAQMVVVRVCLAASYGPHDQKRLSARRDRVG